MNFNYLCSPPINTNNQDFLVSSKWEMTKFLFTSRRGKGRLGMNIFIELFLTELRSEATMPVASVSSWLNALPEMDTEMWICLSVQRIPYCRPPKSYHNCLSKGY